MSEPTKSVVFKNNKLQKKSTSSDFVKNSFKHKNNSGKGSDVKLFHQSSGTYSKKGGTHKSVSGAKLTVPVSKKISISASGGYVNEKGKYHKASGSSIGLGVNIKF